MEMLLKLIMFVGAQMGILFIGNFILSCVLRVQSSCFVKAAEFRVYHVKYELKKPCYVYHVLYITVSVIFWNSISLVCLLGS